jgi:hypothetical protein
MHDDVSFGGPCERCGIASSEVLLQRQVGDTLERRLCCYDCAGLYPDWNRPMGVLRPVAMNLPQRIWNMITFYFRLARWLLRGRSS